MTLQVVGAGLPRTGTSTLTVALEHLLGGRSYHMSVIPGHPFDLGVGWNQALAGETPNSDHLILVHGFYAYFIRIQILKTTWTNH